MKVAEMLKFPRKEAGRRGKRKKKRKEKAKGKIKKRRKGREGKEGKRIEWGPHVGKEGEIV